MKKMFRFKSVKGRLTFWLLAVSLTPLLIFSAIISVQRIQAIKSMELNKLSTIRDLKVERINAWLHEISGNIATFSEAFQIRGLEDVLDGENQAESDTALEDIKNTLNRYLENHDEYSDLFIMNPDSGKIEVATDQNLQGQDRSGEAYFTTPLKTRRMHINDIYYSKTTRAPAMVVSIPIFCLTHGGEHIVGILAARVDLDRSLYALLLNRTGMGQSGETLIVDRSATALSELRWGHDAPLQLKIDAEPAVLASQGKRGAAETTDYRGERVLAAYDYIPTTQWGVVVKQDLKDVYAPIRSMLVNLVILFACSATIAYGLALFLAKNMARPILDMARVSRKIVGGDLSARNRVESEDELGFMAQSFDAMADSVMSRIRVQKDSADIAETMVEARELETFRKILLRKLMETTQSDMGAYHLLNRESGEFEVFASMGISAELLEPFDSSILEGEFGKVLATRRIAHIKDIPEDTRFKFKTFVGAVLPREIITIPVVLDGKVLAVVSLASIKGYSKEVLEVLEHVRIYINTTFSNLLANSETKRLAEELSQKNQELQAQTEELHAQTEELRQTSEELRQQNVELDVQRRQVEEANRLKSEFLSNMSHELRTPLNSVMALSKVLMMQARGKLSAEEASYLAVIERNGKNLLELINDILDLSKVEAGRMSVNPKPFSVGSTIEAIMERLEPIAQEKGIQLNCRTGDLPQIESDESRVHQILQNLIGNAVKFTDKGQVNVSASRDEDRLCIQIEDTGIGIAEKDLPFIFEAFRQVDGSSARKYEGTGLGLAIAYKGARMLGGELFVNSQLGKGSVFTLILPIWWEGPASEAAVQTFAPLVQFQPERKTVLVVDDEPKMLARISEYLTQEGFNAISAGSGEQALMLAARHRPFAITLDIMMPEMDGWEVLQHLKDRPETANIPVIIVSVSEDKETGFALGAVGYLTKPVRKDRLLAEINRIDGRLSRTILVADDNETDRRAMVRMIEQENMSVMAAQDGRQCLEMIRKSKPDILVLDLIMPGMDGFEVINRVRKNPETRDLPVIVVTAKDLSAEERRQLSGKVFSVLGKNEASFMTLLEKLRTLLSDVEKRTTRERSKASARKILLVEDNESAVIQVRTALEGAGYLVDAVRGGQEAIDYVGRTIPDGVILDLMMPHIDGFQVLETIRGKRATARIPVLILTAKDLTAEDLGKLSANNVQQLVQKGDVDQQGLLRRVRRMLGIEPAGEKQGPAAAKAHRVEKRTAAELEPLQKQMIKGLPTILVVEDNPDNMITIKAVLKGRYNILEATDGEAGLEIMAAQRPDLVLLDMSLPKMDGFAVVKKAKADGEISRIPVIALTARAMKGDREQMMAAGCDDYLSKPVEPEEAIQKIDDWLGR